LTYRVPFIDPREHYRRIKSEIDFAITDTLAKGDLVLRQQLRDFEKHLADFVGVQYVVGVNSGYHAIWYYGIDKGIFQKAGIDLEVLESKGSAVTAQTVGNG